MMEKKAGSVTSVDTYRHYTIGKILYPVSLPCCFSSGNSAQREENVGVVNKTGIGTSREDQNTPDRDLKITS